MNQDIQNQLVGYQQVAIGTVQEGDKVTFIPGGSVERTIADADIEIGMTIEEAKHFFDVTVYRRIPVVKQGYLGHSLMMGSYAWMSYEPRWSNPQASVAEPDNYIPQGSEERKQSPMFRGLLGYFPAALFEVAKHSQVSSAKHNPNQPLHWARGKSNDHADCIVRHLIDAGDNQDPDRVEHLRALAWRSLALLQEALEERGARPGVSSQF